MYLASIRQNSTKAKDGNAAEEKGRADGPAGTVAVSAKEEIAQECLIKHPLQNQWTLWYLEMDRSKSWEDMLNEITSFDTVEDFWSLYNHIRVASDLKAGNDYSLFKKNIRPMWEDRANKRGGRWVIALNRSHRHNDLDALWLDIVSVLFCLFLFSIYCIFYLFTSFCASSARRSKTRTTFAEQS